MPWLQPLRRVLVLEQVVKDLRFRSVDSLPVPEDDVQMAEWLGGLAGAGAAFVAHVFGGATHDAESLQQMILLQVALPVEDDRLGEQKCRAYEFSVVFDVLVALSFGVHKADSHLGRRFDCCIIVDLAEGLQGKPLTGDVDALRTRVFFV